MPPRRVTIRDVARAAGVSTTTVSEALSGRGRIAGETRERVRRVAEEVGYVASAAARSLRLGRSGAIGLYVPDRTVGYEYYAQLARGAAEAALGHGLALTLVPPWQDAELLRALHIDGLIVSDPASNDPAFDVLRSLPVPMVTVEDDPMPGGEPVGVVRADHAAAMRRLLDHLRSAGADSVAVLAPGEETAFGSQVRQGCAGAGDVRLVDIALAYEPRDVARAVDDALAGRPDALVAVPDGSALAALQHIQDRGIRIPDDLLLAGYVDSTSLAMVRPAVTAIDIDPRGTGAAAVATLVEVIAGGEPTGAVTEIPAVLQVRASTRPR